MIIKRVKEKIDSRISKKLNESMETLTFEEFMKQS